MSDSEPGPTAADSASPGKGDLAVLLGALDPSYLDAYTEFRNRVLSRNPLDDKTRELVSIAVDASVTHLYQPGLRTHIRRALDIGVKPEEILAVLEMVGLVGVQSVAVGGQILLEEAAVAHGTEQR